MRIYRHLYIALIIPLYIFSQSMALAAEGGYSHYVAGAYGDFAVAVAPPTNLTIRNDTLFYTANGDREVLSGKIATSLGIDSLANLTTILYKPNFKILGAQYAFGGQLPIVFNRIGATLSILGVESSRTDRVFNIGDIVLVPAVLYWNTGKLFVSFSEFVITPTGYYSTSNIANAGLNYWTFDSNIAMTYLNSDTGQDYSLNLAYSYNTKNHTTNYKTGQEFHLDYMINQFFSKNFAVGIHGFYLKQLTGDSGTGARLGDFKSSAAGIGPALLYVVKDSNHNLSLITKWFHEYHATHRLEGDSIWASFVLSL